jgi:hypothetical protein
MREITQSAWVRCRMAQRIGGHEHRPPGGEPMQTLRAVAIAVPFVFLALLVAVLSAFIGATT